MADIFKSLGLVALLALAGPAVAQDSTAAPAADATAAPAAATDQKLETYIDGQFGDWQRECLRQPEGSTKADPCRIVQILKDTQNQPVGKIALGVQPAGSQAVASSEVLLPLDLGILLSQGLSLGVDQGLTKKYNFYLCLQSGCTARLLFSNDDIAAFKAGDKMKLGLVAFLPPDRKAMQISIPVSLKGFTKAYDSIAAAIATPAIAAPAAPAQ